MKTLQSIQKAFQVFEILTKVARIICIVGACLCAVGVLCTVGVSVRCGRAVRRDPV